VHRGAQLYAGAEATGADMMTCLWHLALLGVVTAHTDNAKAPTLVEPRKLLSPKGVSLAQTGSDAQWSKYLAHQTRQAAESVLPMMDDFDKEFVTPRGRWNLNDHLIGHHASVWQQMEAAQIALGNDLESKVRTVATQLDTEHLSHKMEAKAVIDDLASGMAPAMREQIKLKAQLRNVVAMNKGRDKQAEKMKVHAEKEGAAVIGESAKTLAPLIKYTEKYSEKTIKAAVKAGEGCAGKTEAKLEKGLAKLEAKDKAAAVADVQKEAMREIADTSVSGAETAGEALSGTESQIESGEDATNSLTKEADSLEESVGETATQDSIKLDTLNQEAEAGNRDKLADLQHKVEDEAKGLAEDSVDKTDDMVKDTESKNLKSQNEMAKKEGAIGKEAQKAKQGADETAWTTDIAASKTEDHVDETAAKAETLDEGAKEINEVTEDGQKEVETAAEFAQRKLELDAKKQQSRDESDFLTQEQDDRAKSEQKIKVAEEKFEVGADRIIEAPMNNLINDCISSSDKPCSPKDATPETMGADVMDKVDETEGAVKDAVKESNRAVDSFVSTGNVAADQWEKLNEEEGPKEKMFEHSTKNRLDRIEMKQNDFGDNLLNEESAFSSGLDKVSSHSERTLKRAREMEERKMQKTVQQLEREILKVPFHDPDEIHDTISGLNTKMRAMETEVVAPKEQIMVNAWNEAESQAGAIVTSADRELLESSTQLNQNMKEYQRVAAATVAKTQSDAEPVLGRNEVGMEKDRVTLDTSLRGMENDFHGFALSLQGQDAQGTEVIKDESADLQNEDEILKEQTTKAHSDLGAASQVVDQAARETQSGIKNFHIVANADLSGAGQQAILEADAARKRVLDLGAELGPRITSVVDAYISGGATEAMKIIHANEVLAASLDPINLEKKLDTTVKSISGGNAEMMADAHSIQSGIEAYRHALEAGSAEQSAAIAQGQARVQAATDGKINAAKNHVNVHVKASAKTIAEDVSTAEANLGGMLSGLDGALNTFKHIAKSSTDETSSNVLSLKADIEDEKRQNMKYGEKTTDAIQELNEVKRVHEANFADAIGKVGQLMAFGLQKDKAWGDNLETGLKESMDTMRSNIDHEGEEQNNTFTQFSVDLGNIREELNKALEDPATALDDFQVQVQKGEGYEDEVTKHNGEREEEMDKTIRDSGTSWATDYEQQRVDRTNRTDTMNTQSEKIFNQIRLSMESLTHLKNRVVAQVNASSRRLWLDEGDMDDQVSKLMELEKYQEKDALTRVKNDMAHAEKAMMKLREWRGSAEQNSGTWRDFVKLQFKKMGHSLETSEMDIRKEEQEQRWAVDHAMKHLSEQLEGDLGAMDEQTRLQLAKMSKEAGAAIAALMADTTLDAAEKARRIAIIKEEMHGRAKKIIKDNQRLKISQYEMERNIKVAGEDIDNTVQRISSLDTNVGGTGPGDDKLKAQLEAIQEAVDIANQRIPGPAKSVEEETTADGVRSQHQEQEQHQQERETFAKEAFSKEASLLQISPKSAATLRQAEVMMEEAPQDAKEHAEEEAAAFIQEFKHHHASLLESESDRSADAKAAVEEDAKIQRALRIA